MARQNDKKQIAVNEFIVSPDPWVTSSNATGIVSHTFSDTKIEGDLGWVTQWIQVRNTDASGSLKIGFSSLGISAHNNFFTLTYGQSFDKPLAIKQIFISGSAACKYEIIAGLTKINGSSFPTVTSSNGFSGVG